MYFSKGGGQKFIFRGEEEINNEFFEGRRRSTMYFLVSNIKLYVGKRIRDGGGGAFIFRSYVSIRGKTFP